MFNHNSSWQPRPYDTDTAIRYVMVRQLLEADRMHSAAPFRIEGKEFRKVIVVANLCYFRISTTFRDFELDDGTGRIIARQWHNDPEFNMNQPEVQGFSYVRVIGDLDQPKDIKSIKVASIELVASPYELYYHILHAICDTLTYERGPPPCVTKPQQSQIGDPSDHESVEGSYDAEISSLSCGMAPPRLPVTSHLSSPYIKASDSMSSESALPLVLYQGIGGAKSDLPSHSNQVENPINIMSNTLHPQQSINNEQRNDDDVGVLLGLSSPQLPSSRWQPSSRDDPYSKLTPLQRDIILCIQNTAAQSTQQSSVMYPTINNSATENSWEGVHVRVIIRTVSIQRPGLTVSTFTEALEGLIEEGYIFNTIDDEHYSYT